MGAVNKDVELKSFFIFNPFFGPKEGEELKKILYYYPTTDNTGIQIENVGLVEGIVQFTQTFSPSSPVGSLHTSKLRQLYFQPEPNFWVVMTLTLPVVTKVKENISSVEYLEDDVQDNVYEAVLKQMYNMYRLFWGTFANTLEKFNIDTLKGRLEEFYNMYLKTLTMSSQDILSIFGGMQYLPLDRLTFLKIQSFVHSLESKWNYIVHTSFLYNEHIIWSGVEPLDMQLVYQYLIGTLLPSHVETELQGDATAKKSLSPFTSFRYGRFLTGPTNLEQAKTIGRIPKVYLFSDRDVKEYYLVVYRALSATVCLFVEGQTDLTIDSFKVLDEFINPKLSCILNDISEYCSKQIAAPSCTSETSPKFIYFNKFNLAYKSTIHLDRKRTDGIACSKDSIRIMADMKKTKDVLGPAGENIVKTTNDYWVFSKTSNLREFYIVLQQKNASLIEISEEVMRLSESELEGIFFHPM